MSGGQGEHTPGDLPKVPKSQPLQGVFALMNDSPNLHSMQTVLPFLFWKNPLRHSLQSPFMLPNVPKSHSEQSIWLSVDFCLNVQKKKKQESQNTLKGKKKKEREKKKREAKKRKKTYPCRTWIACCLTTCCTVCEWRTVGTYTG